MLNLVGNPEDRFSHDKAYIINVCLVSVFVLNFQTKLENREYKTATDFAEDVRLIFTNCYRYNPPDSDVVMMAKKLQDVFETRFARMPEEPPPMLDSSDMGGGKDDSGSVHSFGDLSDSEEDNESEEEREKKLKELQDQVWYHKNRYGGYLKVI